MWLDRVTVGASKVRHLPNDSFQADAPARRKSPCLPASIDCDLNYLRPHTSAFSNQHHRNNLLHITRIHDRFRADFTRWHFSILFVTPFLLPILLLPFYALHPPIALQCSYKPFYFILKPKQHICLCDHTTSSCTILNKSLYSSSLFL